MGSFGILVGGGPAPGINGVIGSAAMTALQSGASVTGILAGFKWLMEGPELARTRKHVRSLSFADAERLHQHLSDLHERVHGRSRAVPGGHLRVSVPADCPQLSLLRRPELRRP